MARIVWLGEVRDGRGPAGAGGSLVTRADYLFVLTVVGASVVSSVVLALMIVGPYAEAIIPAIVIPAVVSIPASLYLVRQRHKIAVLNRQLEALLRQDQLTGVLTRRYFLTGVQAAVGRGGAMLVIDVDAFKAVNDTWGHSAGDAVLGQIAGRIAAAAGPDIWVGRLGGEEFAVFAPGMEAAAGASLGERLRQAVAARPVAFEGTPIPCTISLGLALVPPGAAEIDPFMRAADRALYRAKRDGRDRLCLAAEPREARA